MDMSRSEKLPLPQPSYHTRSAAAAARASCCANARLHARSLRVRPPALRVRAICICAGALPPAKVLELHSSSHRRWATAMPRARGAQPHSIWTFPHPESIRLRPRQQVMRPAAIGMATRNIRTFAKSPLTHTRFLSLLFPFHTLPCRDPRVVNFNGGARLEQKQVRMSLRGAQATAHATSA